MKVAKVLLFNVYTVIKGAQAVVILAMTANGKLLPPFLVLKVSSSTVFFETKQSMRIPTTYIELKPHKIL